MKMKWLGIAVTVTVVLACFVAPLAAQDTNASLSYDVGSTITIDDLQKGMRVRLSLTKNRFFNGIVDSVDEQKVWLDITTVIGGASSVIAFNRDEIQTITLLEPLSPEQIQAIEQRLKAQKEEVKEISEQAQRRVKQEAQSTEQRLTTLEQQVAQEAEQRAKEQREAEYRAILEEFPPGEGWYEEKVDELRSRWLLLDINPTEKEQRFIDNIELWKKAVEWQKLQEESAEKAEQPPLEETEQTPVETPPVETSESSAAEEEPAIPSEEPAMPPASSEDAGVTTDETVAPEEEESIPAETEAVPEPEDEIPPETSSEVKDDKLR